MAMAELIRWFGAAITMLVTMALTAFTVEAWDRLSPRVVRPILVCVIFAFGGIVYGFGEAASQHAPMGLRVGLVLIPITVLLAVLVTYRLREHPLSRRLLARR